MRELAAVAVGEKVYLDMTHVLKFPMMRKSENIKARKTKVAAFEIGRISHYHNPASHEDIKLTVTVQFDHPAVDRKSFSFELGCHNSTGGTDTIYLSKNAISEARVDVSGHVFALELLGFGRDTENLTRTTQMRNSSHNTERLFGQFVEVDKEGGRRAVALNMPFSVLGLIAVQKPS